MPCLPVPRGRRVRRESKESQARLAMMEPSVRKESKAFKAKPGRRESLEIQAGRPAHKVRQVSTERMALMERKVRPER